MLGLQFLLHLVKGLQHYCPVAFKRICVKSAHCCSVQRNRNQAGCDYWNTCVPPDTVTPLYSAVPRALQQPAQGAAPPHGQTNWDPPYWSRSNTSSLMIHVEKASKPLLPGAKELPVWRPRARWANGKAANLSPTERCCQATWGSLQRGWSLKSLPSPLAQFCPQREGGTASQQNLVHRVVEKRAGTLQPLFLFLKKKKIFFRWEDIPETVIISSVFLTA